MNPRLLQLQQINKKLERYSSLKEVVMPPTGWIRAIRTSLNMSMQQLGNKLSISRQGIKDIEDREKTGSITIKSLKEIGRVMDMKLVYGFVPVNGSLEALVEKRAIELATTILLRTATNMQLEDQGNYEVRLEKAIKEKAEEIIRDMPKILWD